ncbi:MAG: hypothetical protein JRG80_14175 [Deltaproteobacteria bacterium]|nr:hypothetical protein [Deltaproteobacteria bacterium]MBW2667082.1 hypothetical protein [Deltaproteobacteria bacterium]
MRSRKLSLLAIPALVAALLSAACAIESVDRVYEAADAVQPLAPGSRVPSVQVVTMRGEPIDLAKQLRERGALLVFYRGGW